jgi:glycosyltransferase involved in cell wall biosynthesis
VRALSSSKKQIEISIVIPTIGRDSVLIHTLEWLGRQADASFEVILVDQNDGCMPLLDRYLSCSTLKIKYFKQRQKNASQARNHGALTALAPILLFLDDDVIIHDCHFLKSHINNYDDPSIAGVAGQVLTADTARRSSRHAWSNSDDFGWLYFPLNYGIRTTLRGVGRSANLSVRKDVFLSVGGMDENFERGGFREESDFIQRCNNAGYAFVFDPLCSLVHIGEPTGGIRSWAVSYGFQAYHHIVSEWYFLLKHARLNNILHYIVALIRRQILSAFTWKRPHNILWAVWRAVKGLTSAAILLKRGERTLMNLTVFEEHQKTRARR